MTTAWFATSMFALSNITLVGLPMSAALAAVALIGYMFGQRTRSSAVATLDERRQQELDRAVRTAKQLEHIAETLRRDLVKHHAQVAAFKRRLRQVQQEGSDKAWEYLCNEAEAMLGPTMQLTHQLSHAYDQIRQQSDALETFTRGRTDPLTGVGNGRALDQQLRVLLTAASRGSTEFAVALVSLDRDVTTAEGRSLAGVLPVLPRLASVIRACMRDTDFVARYGDDEFVVVMPQTSLAGGRVFSDRLRKRALDDLTASICCGLTEAQSGDDARSLLARADSALYSAKAAGPNRSFVHTGAHIREHQSAAGPLQCESDSAIAGTAQSESADDLAMLAIC
ncbi:MAG: GGDEF domain-containing protein [Planctomycetes bacterium]|nr:GGDEF domain-containing protein [Planctomycetota bacterium]